MLTAASGVQLHAVCIGSISVIERQHGAAPMSERRPSEGPSDEESYSCNGELERPPRCFRHGARRASHGVAQRGAACAVQRGAWCKMDDKHARQRIQLEKMGGRPASFCEQRPPRRPWPNHG